MVDVELPDYEDLEVEPYVPKSPTEPKRSGKRTPSTIMTDETEEDGPLDFDIRFLNPHEVVIQNNMFFEVEVAYPPENMRARERNSNDGQIVYVNRRKRAAVLLSDLPTVMHENAVQNLFADYFYDRIVLLRDEEGPTGTVFIFGPLFFIQLIAEWAPNVRICKKPIKAVLIYEAEFPRLFNERVIEAVNEPSTPANRVLYFHRKA